MPNLVYASTATTAPASSVVITDAGEIFSAGNLTTNGTIVAATIGNASASHVGTVTTATQNSITTMTGLTTIGATGVQTTVAGNLIVGGNLTVSGNSVSISSSTLSIQDPIINLHTPADLTPLSSNDGSDIGLKFHYYTTANGDNHAFLGRANDTGYLEWYDTGNDSANVFAGTTYGTIKAGAAFFGNTIGLTVSGSSQINSLGIGTAASGTAGEIRATNNITAYYSSDEQFKENIRPVPDALGIVTAIGSDLFDWTDAYIADHGGEDGYFVQKSDFGVIAQKVQRVFPQAIRVRPDGSLAVDYEKLGTLAFGAIEQLLARVEALEAKIK